MHQAYLEIYLQNKNMWCQCSLLWFPIVQVYRGEGNNLVTLSSEDDFSCLMTDPMFQVPSNGLSGHQNSHYQQQQQQQHHQSQQQPSPQSHSNVSSYNPQVLSQMETAVVSAPHSFEVSNLLNTRKSKQNERTFTENNGNRDDNFLKLKSLNFRNNEYNVTT